LTLPVPERYFQTDTFFENRAYDPASLSVIEAWQQVAFKLKDPKSHLLLELRRFIVLRETNLTHPELPGMIDSILHVAIALDEPYLIAHIHVQRAWWYQSLKDYSAAFESYLAAYALIRDMTSTYFPFREYSLYSIALAFYTFNDFDKAIEIGLQVRDSPNYPFTKTLTTNMLGMCYLKTAEYDSARYWFTECLQSVNNPLPTTGWIGLIKGNIGYTWYEQKEYDKAIPLFEEGIAKTHSDSIWDNTVGFCCAIADIYMQRGDIEKANTYLEQAQHAAKLARDDEGFCKLYERRSQYFRQTGNYARALHDQDSMLHYKSKIEAATDSKLKVQAEYKFDLQQRIAESDMLKAQTAKHKLVRNLVIGILFLLMLVGLLYFNRRELKHRVIENQLLFDKKQAEEALANSKTQLDDFTRSLKEKNQLIEKFSEEISKLQSLPCNVITPEQTEMLNELRLSAILTDKDWEEFRLRFEKVHVGYLQRLRLKLPDLSPAETRFMTLAKLQLNNKEMGSILGISPDSIRTIRYRLRKKLNLAEEGSMDELINSI
jgi:tetratricopeptide (TPR) repeat protein